MMGIEFCFNFKDNSNNLLSIGFFDDIKGLIPRRFDSLMTHFTIRLTEAVTIMFTSIVLYKKNKNKNDRNLEFQTKKNWN
jgi:hypothetical protein